MRETTWFFFIARRPPTALLSLSLTSSSSFETSLSHLSPRTAKPPAPPANKDEEEGDDDEKKQEETDASGEEEDGDANNDNGQKSATGRRKRKDAGAARRAPARGWSPAEVSLFETALSEHGRDWKAVAARVGTRDARAVASHAQKWLVRLAMKGERVPAKVAAQGGEGYTLSGKPLDATSATAKAYGLKVGVIRKYLQEGREMPGMLLPLPAEEEWEKEEAEKALAAAAKSEEKEKAKEKARAASEATNDENEDGKAAEDNKKAAAGATAVAAAATAAASAAPAAAASGEAPTPSALAVVTEEERAAPAAAAPAAVAPAAEAEAAATTPAAAPANASEDDGEERKEANAAEEAEDEEEAAAAHAPPASPPPPAPPSEIAPFIPPPPSPPRQRTEYALSRPRRAAPQRSAAAAAALRLGATSESLELLACREFSGALEPGCGLPLAQPFALGVSREALAVMDLHAHLHHEEVIGLLGGRWESGSGGSATVWVDRAFPCARASGTGSRTSVELDAAAEVAARAAMADAGLVPVGWYHSHPIFAPTPSRKDAENQRNYQALFRMSEEEEENEKDEKSVGGSGEDGGDGGGCCKGAKAPPRISKSNKNRSSNNNSNVEPFVGAIVGPYDQALPSPAAVTSWFCVAAASAASATGGVGAGSVGGGAAAELAPFSLRCKVGDRAACFSFPPSSSSSHSDSSSSRLREALLEVARASKLESDAVDLSQPWRSFSFVSGGAPAGPALTKGAKARLSLARHLADGAASERLLDEVCAELGVAAAGAVSSKGDRGERQEQKEAKVVAVDK